MVPCGSALLRSTPQCIIQGTAASPKEKRAREQHLYEDSGADVNNGKFEQVRIFSKVFYHQLYGRSAANSEWLSTPSRNALFAAKQKCPVEAGRLEGRW